MTLHLSDDAIANSIATVKLTLSSSAMSIPTLLAAVLSPGPTTWQVRAITGSSDVNKQGSLVLAWQAATTYDGGYGNQTVNGVTFRSEVNRANGVSLQGSDKLGLIPPLLSRPKPFRVRMEWPMAEC